MKKKILKIAVAVVVLLAVATVAFAAGGGLEEIKAYLNYNIKVYYDGVEQTMSDMTGKRVYPISYQGTTYVPIRAVSNMMGIDVYWDGDTKSVLLGKTGVEKDFIEEFTPYAKSDDVAHRKMKDGKTFSLGDKKYNHYIYLHHYYSDKHYLKYDIAGQYTTFTFNAYDYCDATIDIFGDNDTLLASFDIKGGNLPKLCTVDVTGTQQLSIYVRQRGYDYYNEYTYILDAKIK